MDHNQQTALVGGPDDYETLFVDAVIRVWDRN